MSEDLSWQFKLSNWLSNGALEAYKRQAKSARAQLQQNELETENLRSKTEELQRELTQSKAQLQITQGLQMELGEVQLELQQTKALVDKYKLQLIATRKGLSESQARLLRANKNLAQSQDWLQQVQTPIKVIDIKKTLSKKDFGTFWGFGLTFPQANIEIMGGAVNIKGWVLGKKTKVKTLKIIHQGITLLETSVNLPNPIAMQRYPDISTANSSGFEASLTVAGISSETELVLDAVLEDERTVSLCEIVLDAEKAIGTATVN